MSGNIAYVGGYYENVLYIVDIGAPTDPQILSETDMPGWDHPIYSLASYGPLVCVSNVESLHFVDARDPTAPSIRASVTFDQEFSFLGVTAEPTLFEVRPRFYSVGYRFYDPWWNGGYFQIIDAAGLEVPAMVGSVEIPCCPRGVDVQGSHAYVAEGSEGLLVVDVSDPEAPLLAGSVDTPDFAGGVAVSGRIACVADGEAGLQVVDVAIPEAPIIVGSAATPGEARGVVLMKPLAYVACGYGGLQIVDLSDPRDPVIVGGVSTSGYAYEVAVSEGYAHVADGAAGLTVIDVAQPEAPRIVGSLDTPSSASRIAVANDHAYVSANQSGLLVVDVADPTDPRIVSHMDLLDWPGDVTATRHNAYILSPLIGLHVLDITEPGRPRSIGYGGMHESGHGVAASGAHVYVVSGGYCGQASKLRIYPAECGPTLTRRSMQPLQRDRIEVAAAPNPMRGGSSIRLWMPRAERARVSAWDVRGRLVRVLHRGILPAGGHVIAWDGRDGEGRPVSAGIYWIRTATSKSSATARLTVF